MMPTMLLGMMAIMTYRNLSGGERFPELVFTALPQTVPSALLTALVVGSIARLPVTRRLVEPADA